MQDIKASIRELIKISQKVYEREELARDRVACNYINHAIGTLKKPNISTLLDGFLEVYKSDELFSQGNLSPLLAKDISVGIRDVLNATYPLSGVYTRVLQYKPELKKDFEVSLFKCFAASIPKTEKEERQNLGKMMEDVLGIENVASLKNIIPAEKMDMLSQAVTRVGDKIGSHVNMDRLDKENIVKYIVASLTPLVDDRELNRDLLFMLNTFSDPKLMGQLKSKGPALLKNLGSKLNFK